ncbi:MAG: peptide deformylase [Sporichthyaceae bacterium]
MSIEGGTTESGTTGDGGVVGRVRPITYYGDPVLHRPTSPVSRDQPGLDQLIADMFASMHAADGVGLAANQIGVGLSVFVMDCPDEDEDGERLGNNVVATLINPVLHLPDGPRELVERTEGCLSVPGSTSMLARVLSARVTGFNAAWEPVEVSGVSLVARCLQHECDHLAGTVYVDRLGRRAKKAALAEADFTRGET